MHCFKGDYPYICSDKYMRSMRRVEFVPVKLSDVAEIFSVRIDNKEYTELQEFIITIRDVKEKHLHNDYEQILKSLAEISDKVQGNTFSGQRVK